MAKSISWRKFIQKLRTFGFEGPYSGSRHFFMVKSSHKVYVPNPHKHDISGPLVAEILKQANITIKDWETL